MDVVPITPRFVKPSKQAPVQKIPVPAPAMSNDTYDDSGLGDQMTDSVLPHKHSFMDIVYEYRYIIVIMILVVIILIGLYQYYKSTKTPINPQLQMSAKKLQPAGGTAQPVQENLSAAKQTAPTKPVRPAQTVAPKERLDMLTQLLAKGKQAASEAVQGSKTEEEMESLMEPETQTDDSVENTEEREEAEPEASDETPDEEPSQLELHEPERPHTKMCQGVTTNGSACKNKATYNNKCARHL